jgi:hypothetical protein
LLITDGNHHCAAGQKHTCRNGSGYFGKTRLPTFHGCKFAISFYSMCCCCEAQGYALGKEAVLWAEVMGQIFSFILSLNYDRQKQSVALEGASWKDYPLRGPMGQPACAYCGKWHEKLTLDHIVPKSKGGRTMQNGTSYPLVIFTMGAKVNEPVFEWWRPLDCWSEEREQMLLAWVHSNSFVSAHTDIQDWESWMEAMQRVVPVHERIKEAKEKAAQWPPSLSLRLASLNRYKHRRWRTLANIGHRTETIRDNH